MTNIQWLIKIDWCNKRSQVTQKYRVQSDAEGLDDAVAEAFKHVHKMQKSKTLKFVSEIGVYRCGICGYGVESWTEEKACLFWWRHDCRMDYETFFRKWKKDHNTHIELTVRTYSKCKSTDAEN